MISSSGIQGLYLYSAAPGTVTIVAPIRNLGPAVDATVKLYVYEGSWLPTHGKLLAEYSQDVHFDEGGRKEVEFTHAVVVTDEARRDVGVEVLVAGEVQASREFDDVYTMPTRQGQAMGMLMQMLMIMPMFMMMGMLMEGVS